MALSSLLRRVQLEDVSCLNNEDVRPCDAKRRTWNALAFHNYWLLINCTIATFMAGSSLIPIGLSWWQAIISITIGNILVTGAILLSSLQGANYHIGFSVYSRAVWGIWGAQFTIWNRIFLSFVWYGFQAWVGGQCVYLMLLSWDPRYESRIANGLPDEAGTTSARFVCYVLFSLVSLPFIWIRPHRLQAFFYATSSVAFAFFLVLLVWALATMGPAGFGETLGPNGTAAKPLPATGPGSVGWQMVLGVVSTLGSIAAGILNQSDFARLARRPAAAFWGQAVAYPVYAIYASVLGILVVAATQNRFGGEPIWFPPALFERLLEAATEAEADVAGTRAALFFAGLALAASQLGSSIPGNALAGGIDLAAVLPRYINIRRGAYLTALVSPVVNPWRLVSTAPIFLSVLMSYGIFLAPMTGMMTANYLVVCRQKLKVEDLYRGDGKSIYWYWHGLNWRAVVAWTVGVTPCLPGFLAQVNASVQVSDAAVELYYLSYVYGYLSSGLVYVALHWLFPARALDAFVRQPVSASSLQQYYREQWDATEPEASDIGRMLSQSARTGTGTTAAKERMAV